jgi:hypothetical protein
LSSKLPTERSFGLLFAGVFAFLASYGLYKGWPQRTDLAWLGASLAVLLIALVVPRLLAPFNKAWYLLGQLLGRIVSPIVLGLIFFVLLTPIAVITRLFGRDELKLKRRDVASHWIVRTPPGPPADSFNNQF